MNDHYPMFGRQARARLRAGLFFCAALLALGAHASEAEQQDEGKGDLSDEESVIIKSPGQHVIDEYRINGKLYMIRITPKKGAPYYLVDADGDGDLETRSNELAPDFLIPSWVIFSW